MSKQNKPPDFKRQAVYKINHTNHTPDTYALSCETPNITSLNNLKYMVRTKYLRAPSVHVRNNSVLTSELVKLIKNWLGGMGKVYHKYGLYDLSYKQPNN